MRVFAVVVNWNGGESNLACIESLAAQGLARGQLVFVDNGSSDGSLELVRERCEGVAILENAGNLGFGEASNRGALHALERGAQAVLFVNNDVVLPAGVLARLVEELEREPRRGIVGPRVVYMDEPERIWAAGGALTWRQNLSTLRGHGRPDGPAWRASGAVDYIVGCAMLVRSEVLERVGLFDPTFFAYMEDVDLCLRAAAQGWGVHLVGDVAARHASSSATGGGYSPRRKYMTALNSVWFMKRHARPAHWLRFLLFDVASLPFAWVVGLFRGRATGVAAKAAGILAGLRGRRVTAEAIREGASWMW